MKKQIFLFFFFFFFVCRFTFYVDRQPTTKEDRQTFFLLLSFFRVHMRGLLPEEEVKKTNRRRCFSHEAVLTCYSQSSFELRRERSNFVSPKSVGVRCFRSQERSPPFLSSVVECDDEREKEVHTRARREKIRICAIVPLSAMISSSSSESTSIVAVIFCDESSNRCESLPLRLSLLFCRRTFFCVVQFLFLGV